MLNTRGGYHFLPAVSFLSFAARAADGFEIVRATFPRLRPFSEGVADIDPSTGQPHMYGHDVTKAEVEDVLARPLEDRQGSEGSRGGRADRSRAVSTSHLRS
jgi:hypothetical protein